MASYSVTKICHGDADLSNSKITRHIVALGICVSLAQVGQHRGDATGTCTSLAVVDGQIVHRQPIMTTAVVSGIVARHTAASVTPCVSTAQVLGVVDHSQPALEQWQLFHALGDAPIDFAYPIETYTSLPHTTSTKFLTPGKHRFVVRKRNAYGYDSENMVETVLWVGDDGNIAPGGQPTPPQCVSLEQSGTDTFVFDAIYDGRWDSPYAANFWEVWTTYDGSEPSPGTPDSDVALLIYALFPPAPGNLPDRIWHLKDLELSTPIPTGLANGTVVKMRTRMSRQTVTMTFYSSLTDTVTITINDSGPPAPKNLGIEYFQEHK